MLSANYQSYNTNLITQSNPAANSFVYSSKYTYDYHRHPNSRKVYDIYTSRQESKSLKGIRTKTTTRLSADGLGNVTHITETKIANGETYTTKTTNSYAIENTSDWIIGRLSKSTVLFKAQDGTKQKRTTAFTYDAATGQLTSETQEPGGSLTLTKRYTYDRYGNKLTEKVSGTGIETAKTTYAYSDAYNKRFVTSLTDALDHTETRSYDPATGAVTKINYPDGSWVTYRYDAMGKKIEEVTPFGRTRYIHQWERNANILYKLIVSGTNTPTTTTYYDRLGREVKKIGTDIDNHTLTSTKTYNARGEVIKEQLPGSITITHRYDRYGRETQTTHPSPEGSGTTTTTITYRGLTTTSHAGLTKSTTKNALGKVAKVTEGNGAGAGRITYRYYPDGSLKSTTDAKGNTISFTYDALGYKKRMTDPDLGAWHYTHDALGRVLSVTDAKGQRTQMRYDKLGRMVQKFERGYDYLWEYDARAVGKLYAEYKNRTDGTPMYEKQYYYNRKNQLIKTVETLDGSKRFSTRYRYYPNGKLKDLIYPNNPAIRHLYQNGYLQSIEDGTTGESIYSIETDEAGRLQNAAYENGIIETYIYNKGGVLAEQSATDIMNQSVVHLSYTYDARGNVQSFTDHLIGYANNRVKPFTQTYTYNSLNRLTSVTANNTRTDYRYDVLGNITRKGARTLIYTGAHRLKRTNDGRHYTYDANGNIVSDGTRSYTYNPANKPVRIKTPNDTVTFAYASDGHRYKKTFNGGFATTYYIGKLFERTYESNNANYVNKNYIYFNNTLVKIKEKHYWGSIDKPTYKDLFLHHDRPGNIIALSDTNGKIIQRRSYKPFGEIRPMLYKEAIQQGKNLTTTQMLEITNRAFTSHESIDDTLVHMNGRVYDSSIGRFISPDPFVQAPYESQNYNRYAYVMNNPLNYTDPSGYWSVDLGIIKIGNHGTSNGFVTRAILRNPLLQTAGYIVAGFYGGIGGVTAYSAYITKAGGGSRGDAVRSAAFTAASAWVSAGIGDMFGHDASFLTAQNSEAFARATAKAIAHGLSRAAIAKMRYGSAKGAFLSGFVSSGFSIGNKNTAVSSTVAMMIVGGTVAEIGGGKFSNGALSAMFVHMFNRLMTREEFIQENYSQDPNAQALQSALGDNAENWYGKDAPVAKAIFTGLKTGAQVGSIMYWGTASLYGAGSSAAIAGGLTGLFTGTALGIETQLGLGYSKIKIYLKQQIIGLFQ